MKRHYWPFIILTLGILFAGISIPSVFAAKTPEGGSYTCYWDNNKCLERNRCDDGYAPYPSCSSFTSEPSCLGGAKPIDRDCTKTNSSTVGSSTAPGQFACVWVGLPLKKCVTDNNCNFGFAPPDNCSEKGQAQCAKAAGNQDCVSAPIPIGATDSGDGGTIGGPTSPGGGLVPCGGTDCDLNDLYQLIINIIQFMIEIAGILAVLFFLYGGFVILTSGGSSERMQTGKRAVTAAAVGLVIVLASIIIIHTFFTLFVRPASEGGCDSILGNGGFWTVTCSGAS